MCHQVLAEVLDLKIVCCNFLSAFLLAWMGDDPFCSCGGFDEPPACIGGSLSVPTHSNSADGAAQQAASKCTPLPHTAGTPIHV